MNSLFDPECHRQVLGKGKRQRNKKREGKRRWKKENWSYKVGQAV